MINIAIDGPSGAGKSSVAQCVAESLGFFHVDTGALYRAVAFYIKNNNISKNYIEIVLNNLCLELKFIDLKQHVFLNKRDVNSFLRDETVSEIASCIAKNKDVRDFLLNLQRNFAQKNNVIMDGRDIASVVLPHAQVKIFLTASAEARAARRYKELLEKECKTTFEEVLKNIICRDKSDTEREIAPLKMSHDAIKLDSSFLSFTETTQKIIQIINNKLQNCF